MTLPSRREGTLELLEDRSRLNCHHPHPFPQLPLPALLHSSWQPLMCSPLTDMLMGAHALKVFPVVSVAFILTQVPKFIVQTGHGLSKNHVKSHVGQAGLENHSKNARKKHSTGLFPLSQLMKLQSIKV